VICCLERSRKKGLGPVLHLLVIENGGGRIFTRKKRNVPLRLEGKWGVGERGYKGKRGRKTHLQLPRGGKKKKAKDVSPKIGTLRLAILSWKQKKRATIND